MARMRPGRALPQLIFRRMLLVRIAVKRRTESRRPATALGWTPSVDREVGLTESIAYFRDLRTAESCAL